jgi:alanyl-tRNA synthetase
MSHQEIRRKFLEFFEKRGHKVVPSSSLIPDDPSVLFTTAGMQQFKPYFLGTVDPMKDFGTMRTASIQKSMRTSDIDEIGDKSHLTFFEMLGHFSFGDYFKKETIEWTYLLLTDVFKISPDRISATVFAGDEKIPFDKESYEAWLQFLPHEKIKKGLQENNVWGPAGAEGPCGAANEVYVDDLEAATLVFMEYYCDKNGNLAPLDQKGVDVGWGFERIAMIVQQKDNIFETDLFESIWKTLPDHLDTRVKRIICDHSRAAAFVLADGVRPSNKDQGYVLRRLMRRLIVHENLNEGVDIVKSIQAVLNSYQDIYPSLKNPEIIAEFEKEKEKFGRTLSQGLKEMDKISDIDAVKAFRLYESFGLPYEIIKELGKDKAESLTRQAFEKEFKKHQEKSRFGVEKKFGGHGLLLDTGELKAGDEEGLKKATRLHTATHLLHAALRKVLGLEVKQTGSDITAERLRFDFLFPRKMTPGEIKQTEDTVNEVINKGVPVKKEKMSYDKAIKSGALAFFKQKYPEMVSVYSIDDPIESGKIFSKELCGGPHVSNTLEIGRFKIVKEESVSAGTRRIRAVVE